MGRRHIADPTFDHNGASLWNHKLVKNSEAIDVITLCLYCKKIIYYDIDTLQSSKKMEVNVRAFLLLTV